MGEHRSLGRWSRPYGNGPPTLALHGHNARRARTGDPGVNPTDPIDGLASQTGSQAAQHVGCHGIVVDLSHRQDLPEIRRRLAETTRDWSPALFPNGRISSDGRTLRCADLTGRRARGAGSCVIHLEGRFAGSGFDHATGESAGPIDLIYHATGLTDTRLFAEAARLAGMDRPAPKAHAREARSGQVREIARILRECRPLAGTAADTYLRSRGLEPPDSADLLFHPNLADFETRRGRAGMIAIVRNSAGDLTGGIHRTYLLDDGAAKASPGRKMLGPIAGGAIRLAPCPCDGHVGVAEGSRPRWRPRRSSACRL